MTGETYTYQYLRAVQKQSVEEARRREKLREERLENLVKEGKMKKVIIHDPKQKLTTIRYVRIEDYPSPRR